MQLLEQVRTMLAQTGAARYQILLVYGLSETYHARRSSSQQWVVLSLQARLIAGRALPVVPQAAAFMMR
jgi:hypothetical protein